MLGGVILFKDICIKSKTLLGVIDYNFLCFRDAITQVFELRNKSQGAIAAARARADSDLMANGAGDSGESTSDHSQVQLP